MKNSQNLSPASRTEKKKFNLLRFIYGELFLCSLTTTKSSMVIESWKYYRGGWRGILNWLQENKYLSCLQVIPIDNQQIQIRYIFNHNNVMYKPYLNYLQKITNSRTIKLYS